MKKFLFLSLLAGTLVTTQVQAQSGNAPVGPQAGKPQTSNTPSYDPATVLQQMKKIVPDMVAKTGITEAQANRVIELNFEMRHAAGAIDVNDPERAKKIAELKAAKEKSMSELLTADQILAVKNFYEEMGKNAPKRN